MREKITAKKSDSQYEDYTLWDNKVVLTALDQHIDIDDVIAIADDNGGTLMTRTPLTFIFYESGQRWDSVEVDNFLNHIYRL